MKVYLLRNVETKSILGIYWASSILDLWWTIDEDTDPSGYEYTVINKPSGLVFSRKEPVAAQWDDSKDDEEPPPFSWRGATTTEYLDLFLHYQSDCRWKRMPYADEEGGGVHDVITTAIQEGKRKA